MSLSLRPISKALLPLSSSKIVNFLIKRNQLSPSPIQSHHFSTFSEKIVGRLHQFKNFIHKNETAGKLMELLTEEKLMSEEESKQALINHQKLWVAHYSISNHSIAHYHWERAFSMQLFNEIKDFSTQQYYLNLLEKKGDLAPGELQELIDLYSFALAQEEDSSASIQMKQQLEKHLSALKKH